MRLMEGSQESIYKTFTGLVQNAKDSGKLRADLNSGDLVRAFLGVFYTTGMPGWEASARRIIDLLIDGARTVKNG